VSSERTAVVVPGHGEIARYLRLVGEAERVADRIEADVVIFSGWSSEAERMLEAWRGRAAELVLEPTARTTAENASRTLPLVLDRGVGRVVVVCAPPHLVRTRLFFRRLYSARGVAVGFRVARARPTLSAVAWELAALPLVPVQLRAARAELDRRIK
jgi:uncharacterized SAM-binding protein YcdF (DUF218 family)